MNSTIKNDVISDPMFDPVAVDAAKDVCEHFDRLGFTCEGWNDPTELTLQITKIIHYHFHPNEPQPVSDQ